MSIAAGGNRASIATVSEALASLAAAGQQCLPRGRGTKDALSTAGGGLVNLDTSGMTGIVEYAPSEFTVTALAGTPVGEIQAALAEHGQYLPFDPILVDAGATLGGTVAAGVSGSGRLRYGGLRDFILGVSFFDGERTLVRGGGKVVKNAAGFDLPKLMVGSLGSLGVLVEITLKVFPGAEAAATGAVDLVTVERAVEAMHRVLRGPSEVDALDLEPPGRLWIRVAGRARALEPRLERALRLAVGDGTGGESDRGAARTLGHQEAADHWRAMRELDWVPPGSRLVKVPLVPGRIAALETALREVASPDAPRAVYTAGGQQALVAWPAGRAIAELDTVLERQELSGLVVRGSSERRRLGRRPAEAAIERVRRALDPNQRFREP